MSGTTSEEIKEVWKAFKQNPSDQELRNQLIEQYLPLVRYHAGKLWDKLPDEVDVNDLFSAGVFGLMDAIDKYDLERGIKFETYCALRIRGAMLDELRKMDWVPRLVRTKARKLAAAQRSVEETLNRPPTDEEVGEKMQLTPEELGKFKKKAAAIGMVDLDKKYFDTDSFREVGLGDLLEDTKGENPVKNIQNRDLMQLVTREFSKRDRLLIILYYFEKLTMKQVADSLGVGESRVSQMHKDIMRRLRKRLSGRRSDFV